MLRRKSGMGIHLKLRPMKGYGICTLYSTGLAKPGLTDRSSWSGAHGLGQRPFPPRQLLFSLGVALCPKIPLSGANRSRVDIRRIKCS